MAWQSDKNEAPLRITANFCYLSMIAHFVSNHSCRFVIPPVPKVEKYGDYHAMSADRDTKRRILTPEIGKLCLSRHVRTTSSQGDVYLAMKGVLCPALVSALLS